MEIKNFIEAKVKVRYNYTRFVPASISSLMIKEWMMLFTQFHHLMVDGLWKGMLDSMDRSKLKQLMNLMNTILKQKPFSLS